MAEGEGDRESQDRVSSAHALDTSEMKSQCEATVGRVNVR